FPSTPAARSPGTTEEEVVVEKKRVAVHVGWARRLVQAKLGGFKPLLRVDSKQAEPPQRVPSIVWNRSAARRCSSEGKRHSTPDCPRGLHEIDRPPVLAYDGDVALCQEIAHVYDSVHVAGEECIFGDGLANKEIKVRIDLSGGGVEHVHWRESLTVSPAIGSNPMRFRARHCAAEFCRHALVVSGLQPAVRFFHGYIGLAQSQHAAVAVIECSCQVRRQLALQHDAHASR